MRKSPFLVFLFFCSMHLVYPQITGLPTLTDESLFKNDVINQFQQQYSQLEKFPSAPIIIDSLYYVGPGDILSIMILPVSVKPDLIRICHDGKILLPRYGDIDLRNLTLKDAKNLIEKTVKQHNDNASVFLSLFQPRIVMVSVSGAVLNPGTYALPATYRVSDVITYANQMNPEKYLPPNLVMNYYFDKGKEIELNKEISSNGLPNYTFYSNRNISVYNSRYGVKDIDIELSLSRNNFELNPYIREGDLINVPFEPIYYETASVVGSVVRPGKFAFKIGDKVSDLLKFGLGFRNNADFSNISYVTDSERISIEVDSNFNVINDFAIKPNSFLIVGEKNKSKESTLGVVKIDGMVEKPGFYTIEIGKTKLLDVLSKCGAFLPEADLAGSYILRRKLHDSFYPDPNALYGKYYLHSNLTMEDSMRFRLDINYRREYVSCNFANLILNNDTNQNIVLEDGDLILINKTKKSVFVWGQVKNPGYVNFSEGKNCGWYIEKVGGYLPTANPARTRIIRGIQKIWLPSKGTNVLAGDEIYVPRNPDMPPGLEVQYYSLIATGVATLISLTYLIINLTRRN